MARPRKATAVLEANGAFDHDPQRARINEPEAPEGDVIKPKLRGRASEIWDQYAPICIKMQTLCYGDEMEFATYCQLQAEWEKKMDKFSTSRLAHKRAYAERFGLAGAGSRAKISLPPMKEKDVAEEYFN